jgi:glycerophosphoryl diester phosphodiesterase
MKTLVLALALGLSAVACAEPVVIAHRGASGYLPEHTLAAYALAIQQGADFVEPDLVPTKDGALVARHENNISDTTDVAQHPEFATRRTRKIIDGQPVEGWFTEDFTLAELKTLRARGRNRASRAHDGKYPIPTLEEVLDLVAEANGKAEDGRVVGVYPETKHPSYFQGLGLALEVRLVDTLHRYGYRGPEAPAVIQSFEVANLRKLHRLTGLRLAQLVDTEGAPADWAGTSRKYADMLTPEGLAEVATYAFAIAPQKGLVIPTDAQGRLGQPTGLIERAHAAGLQVHCWTFRAENQALPGEFRRGTDPEAEGDLTSEVRRFFQAGLDAVFANHPDQAVQAKD